MTFWAREKGKIRMAMGKGWMKVLLRDTRAAAKRSARANSPLVVWGKTRVRFRRGERGPEPKLETKWREGLAGSSRS